MLCQHYRFEAKAVIQFAGDELRQLQALSQQHYDARCRAAGLCGGFLYGWVNMYRFEEHGRDKLGLEDAWPGFVTIECAFSQLDVVAKIAEAENGHLCFGGVPVAGRLGAQLRAIMREIITRTVEVNGDPAYCALQP